MHGVDLTLPAQEYLFLVGQEDPRALDSVADLAEHSNAATLFIPVTQPGANFRVLLEADGSGGVIELQAGDGVRHLDVELNRRMQVGAVTLAIKREDEAWSDHVLSFKPVVETAHARRAIARPLARPIAASFVCLSLLAAFLFAWPKASTEAAARVKERPEQAGQPLASTTDSASWRGRDGKRYAWATTAIEAYRLRQAAGMAGTQVLELVAERDRLHGLLDAARIPHFAVRLTHPDQPVVLLSAGAIPQESGGEVGTDWQRDLASEAKKLVLEEAAYARDVLVEWVEDESVIQQARSVCAQVNLPCEEKQLGDMTLLQSEGVFDDRQIDEFNKLASEFRNAWGASRVRLQMRLTEDPTHGHSYITGPNGQVVIEDGVRKFTAKQSGE